MPPLSGRAFPSCAGNSFAEHSIAVPVSFAGRSHPFSVLVVDASDFFFTTARRRFYASKMCWP